MDIGWLESLLYGFISGLSEFMPVSAQAHRSILLKLFGADSEHPVMSLCIHIGTLAALIFAALSQLRRLYREYKLKKVPARRRRKQPDMQSILDISLVKTAAIPTLLAFMFFARSARWHNQLHIVALFLFLNGVALHIPMYLSQGNKDSRSMSRLDGLLCGLAAATGILPGVSRVGMFASASIARGAHPQQAFKWALLLSIPSLAVLIIFDLFFLFTAESAAVGFLLILKCILAAASAFLGANISISLMRFITVKAGLYNFAYYCLGLALFTFVLYLI